VIDFAPFLSGNPFEKRETAEAITNAFKTAGFVYLKNVGIAPSFVQRVFSSSASMFSLPQAEKDLLASISPDYRGYVAPGREKLAESSDAPQENAETPDLKETFEIGREGPDQPPNLWPQDLTFKSTMCDLFVKGQILHMQIMSAIAIGLGLDEEFFDAHTNYGDNGLRLLHYPSVTKETFTKNSRQVRAGAHTDYGKVTFKLCLSKLNLDEGDITILFQDDRGGLQVMSPNGEFVNATPIPDTVIVNAGDLLARWSNDVIKSTLHRVIEPPVEHGIEYPARYSVAYFGQPNLDAWIEGIPGTVAKGQKNKYDPVQSGQYLAQRLGETYTY
jgi:isopenicillin N synthase-like dioxygenase